MQKKFCADTEGKQQGDDPKSVVRQKLLTIKRVSTSNKNFLPQTLLAACLSLALLLSPNLGLATTVTFEDVAAGVLPFGGTYTENGMKVTSYSDYSQIGDPLGWNPTGNALYFHGEFQYVEFSMTDGSLFNLLSFDFLTNGSSNVRWIETSKTSSDPNERLYLNGVTSIYAGTWIYVGTLDNLTFSSTEFQDIGWFRIVSAGRATEMDNVVFELSSANDSVPIPEPSTIILLGIGILGLINTTKKCWKK